MLSAPYLAKCSDRNSMPKFHPTSGSPEDWFSDAMLSRHNYLGLSFDFFVNWSKQPNVLTPVIWVKRILEPSVPYQKVLENLSDILVSHFGNTYFTLLDSFRNVNSLSVQLIIFHDDFNWSDSKSNLLMVDFKGKSESGFIFEGNIVDIELFKSIIQSHSGGPIQIGSKGLIYGTSNLECFLSTTTSLYPGDVDLIVFNKKFEPLALLEYKKHTLTSSISDQKLSNYYPSPDGRKYNRLSILRDYLGQISPNLPLFNIYYPTNPAFNQGKMELLKGATGSLQTNVGSIFPLPRSTKETEFDEIIIKLTKGISYHKSLR